jgi:manganese oxidase
LNARTPYQQAGQWGYKVLPLGDRSILPLGKETTKGVKNASQPMEEDKAASMVKDDRLSMRQDR